MSKQKTMIILHEHIRKMCYVFSGLFIAIILCGATGATGNYWQEAMISLNVKDVSIRDVFVEIEKNSEFIFFYKNEDIDIDRKVSIQVDNQTIEVILSKLFSETGYSFMISDRQVFIAKSMEPPAKEEEIAQQQPGITVTGTVKDDAGELLPGVAIMIKGTTQGTSTDIDGKFTLTVPSNDAVLSFSFIGFNTLEVPVGSRRDFNITLSESAMLIEEVVVVGYGVQKKASLVGAIAQTTAENIAKSGVTNNLANSLTGHLAGVATILNTGQPGNDDPTIVIRARGTWNNSDPLILVDGIERRMNDIDVNEVESVSVLKDASATAIYGTKGSEGVILITTKRGSVGKARLSVEANASVKELSLTPEKMESYEAMMWRNMAIENELPVLETNWSNYRPMEWVNLYRMDNPLRKQLIPNTPYYYEEVFPNVDWPKEMLKPFAMSYRANVNVRGGTDFVRYFGSLSYTYDGDLLRSGLENGQPYDAKFAYDRVNFRSNLDFNLTKTTVFVVNLSGYVGTRYTSWTVDSGQQGVVYTPFYDMAPSEHTVRFSDGYWGYTRNRSRDNPVAHMNGFGLKKDIRTQVTTDFSLRQNLDFITKGLRATASLSFDTRFNTQGGPPDEMNAFQQRYVDPRIIFMDPSTETYWNYVEGTEKDKNRRGQGEFEFHPTPVTFYPESFGSLTGSGGDWWGNSVAQPYQRLYYLVQLDYSRNFAGKHDVAATAVFNREQYFSGGEFPRYREDWAGRATYGYDSRYSIEVNGAYNGSERFGSAYRFGFFPSIGAGWIISNEPFIRRLNLNWLNHLKLRYSIGKTGNDNHGAARWAYQTTWSTQTGTRFGVGSRSPYTQYRENNVGNPDIRWEASTKQNLGFEFNVLQNLLALSVEVYRDDRDGIYMSASQRSGAVPAYFGAPAVPGNIGQTETHGYEIDIRLRKRIGDFYPWANLNYSHAIDKIIYMEDAELLPDYQKNAGYQISQFRTTLVDGFMNNWDDIYGATKVNSNQNRRLPGDYALVDFNGDGVIDSNDSAPYSYPTNRPQNTWNFTMGLDYKKWSFMIQFYGVFNQTRSAALSPLSGAGETVFAMHRDYWTPENTDAAYKAPRYSTGNTSNGYWGIYDGAYTRLKSAEIAYRVEGEWLKRIGLSSLRIFVNGNNLILWSDWPDDRESGGASGYPMYRLINAGFTINF